MFLTMHTIERILELPSPYIRHSSTESSFSLILSVQEGLWCRFTGSSWADQVLTSVAQDLARDIGWKSVDLASRRQVVIRCTVVRGAPNQASAEMDRGLGFEPLKIIELSSAASQRSV